MSKPLKIFIGNNDIALLISDLKLVFNGLGIETLSISDIPNASIIRVNVNYNFSEYKKWWFRGIRSRKLQRLLQDTINIHKNVWRKAIKEFDIFKFTWNSFKPDFSDFIELKNKGKTLKNIFACNEQMNLHQISEIIVEKLGISPKFNFLKDSYKDLKIIEDNSKMKKFLHNPKVPFYNGIDFLINEV